MDPRDEETLKRLLAFLQGAHYSEVTGFLFGGEDPKAVATVIFDQGEFVFYTEEGKRAVHKALQDHGLSNLFTDRLMGSP